MTASRIPIRSVSTAATVGAFRAAFQAWLAQPTASLADHLEAAFNHLEAGLTATPR